MRILDGLRTEGVEPALVSWAISRELCLLARLKTAIVGGESEDGSLNRNRVWRRRHSHQVQPGLSRGGRCAAQWLLSARHETDFRQRQAFQQLESCSQVAVMDRVERSAENADGTHSD